MAKEIRDVRDLTTWLGNPNKGTERGRAALEKSLQKLGAGRSIVADAEGRIIAGNHVLEVAAEMGLPVEVVQTDGTKLVVVQRTDLRLDRDKAAVELGYADNRLSEINFELDPVRMADDLARGVDLGDFYSNDEMAKLLKSVNVDIDGGADGGGGGGGKEKGVTMEYAISFDTAAQQERWYRLLHWLQRAHDNDTAAARIDDFLQALEAEGRFKEAA